MGGLACCQRHHLNANQTQPGVIRVRTAAPSPSSPGQQDGRHKLSLPATPFDEAVARPASADLSGESAAKEESLVVALRVRPLTEREKLNGEDRCIEVFGEQEVLFQPRLSRSEDSPLVHRSQHHFAFDHVLPETSTQGDLFHLYGDAMAKKAFEGINVTLFAYGQTGSGKTHTIAGSEEDPGFMPRFIGALFRNLEEKAATTSSSHQRLDMTLVASYVEIYNEVIYDLLRKDNNSSSSHHSHVEAEEEEAAKPQIRESVDKGMYLENVVMAPVTTSEQVLQLIKQGSSRRATAETKANESSSRSHAILTLHLTQETWMEGMGGMGKVTSKVNIVDLAGSERVKATGAVGERLKEGGAINLSLLVLGKVANALTSPDSSTRHVPYRESKLTRILQDSLGGNSFTVMCCNVSPSYMHEQETLSSLRFADRIKKITNKVKVNRDPMAEKVAALMHENSKLRAYIAELEARIQQVLHQQAGVGNRHSSSTTTTTSSPHQDSSSSRMTLMRRLSSSGGGSRKLNVAPKLSDTRAPNAAAAHAH